MTDHGYAAYSRHNGCRCETCRAAKAEYMRHLRAERQQRAKQFASVGEAYIAPTGNHGSRHTYKELGCRCDACTDAKREWDRKYWKGRAS